MLSSAPFKPFFFNKYVFAFDVFPCFPVVAVFYPLVLPEKYIFQRRKQISIRSSQLHLIILKNFLSRFLPRFVEKRMALSKTNELFVCKVFPQRLSNKGVWTMSRLWSPDFSTLVKKDPTLSVLWNSFSRFTTLDFATVFIALSDSGDGGWELAFGSVLSYSNLLFLVSENPWRLFCRERLLTVPKQKCCGSWGPNPSGWREMCRPPGAFWPWRSRWVC